MKILVDLRSPDFAVVTLVPSIVERILGHQTQHRDAERTPVGWVFRDLWLQVPPRVERAIDRAVRDRAWEPIWRHSLSS